MATSNAHCQWLTPACPNLTAILKMKLPVVFSSMMSCLPPAILFHKHLNCLGRVKRTWDLWKSPRTPWTGFMETSLAVMLRGYRKVWWVERHEDRWVLADLANSKGAGGNATIHLKWRCTHSHPAKDQITKMENSHREQLDLPRREKQARQSQEPYPPPKKTHTFPRRTPSFWIELKVQEIVW